VDVEYRIFVHRNGRLDTVVETLPKHFMQAKFYRPTGFQRIAMKNKLSKSLHT